MTVDDATGHNTWAVVRQQADGANDQKTQMAYAIAQVSESVTVRLTTAGAFRSIIIEEWAHTGGGSIALDQQNGEGLNSQTDPVTPPITPTGSDALVLAATQGNGSGLTGSAEVSAPFTFENDCSQDASNPGNENVGVASYQQTTPASISATFHFGGSQSTSTIIASFLPPQAPPPTFGGSPRRGLMAVR